MSVLERLSRFVGGGASPEARQALHACYVDAVNRAQLLSRHAETAPQLYSQEALRRLASAEAAQAERLGQALLAVGAAASAVSSEPPPSRSLNHWGRLVQDLELHRVAFRRLRELAVQFAESLPSTADLLDQLCREERHHCEQIRELIARADPQALD